MSNLVDAYLRYRLKNAEIKRRQKQERDAELLPLLRDMGYEIAQEKQSGTSVEGIHAIIGSKNNTLIYAARRAFEASEDKPVVTETASSNEYRIEVANDSGTSFRVIFPDAEYFVYKTLDVVDRTPDEWATHGSERRKLYKQIIKEIENGATS